MASDDPPVAEIDGPCEPPAVAVSFPPVLTLVPVPELPPVSGMFELVTVVLLQPSTIAEKRID
jgi:hypothetical protein